MDNSNWEFLDDNDNIYLNAQYSQVRFKGKNNDEINVFRVSQSHVCDYHGIIEDSPENALTAVKQHLQLWQEIAIYCYENTEPRELNAYLITREIIDKFPRRNNL